jgi:PIN domain nuclease of toxin-antitoxin system
MSRYVTDTHALYWHLSLDQRLTPQVLQILRDADNGLHQILIPGIVLIEMVYLVEKGRLSMTNVNQVFSLLEKPGASYAVAQLDQHVARALQYIPRVAIPDMPDRIVTATAYYLGVPLITKDSMIHKAGIVDVVW